MLFHPNYCKPPNKKLARYAESLYGRKHEGLFVPRQMIHLDNWQPLQNRCHANALILETFGEGFTAVHGWFFIDYDGARDFVRFIAHSMVMTEDGHLLDITPSYLGPSPHPFIAAHLSNDDYEATLDILLKKYGTTECLDYLI